MEWRALLFLKSGQPLKVKKTCLLMLTTIVSKSEQKQKSGRQQWHGELVSGRMLMDSRRFSPHPYFTRRPTPYSLPPLQCTRNLYSHGNCHTCCRFRWTLILFDHDQILLCLANAFPKLHYWASIYCSINNLVYSQNYLVFNSRIWHQFNINLNWTQHIAKRKKYFQCFC